MSRRTGDRSWVALPDGLPRQRRRILAVSLLIVAVALFKVRHAAFLDGLPRVARLTPATSTSRGELTRRRVEGDAVNNVSPEMNAAAKQYAQRYEDIVLRGKDIWRKLKKAEVPKKFFFVGVPGAGAGEICESTCDALGYVPAPDGVQFIHRKPGMGYTPIKYTMWETEKLIGNKSSIAPTDLFMEDEEKYRDLESEVLQDFVNLEPNGYPMACVVGEGAVMREANVELMKNAGGVIVWLDIDPVYSWMKVMTRPSGGGCGLFIPPEFTERPPPWAIANGWDGDPDDTEGKEQYVRIIESRRAINEKLADVRIRADVPGIADNSYWGAERILKQVAELLGISEGGTTVEEEVMERDLTKFLEGADCPST